MPAPARALQIGSATPICSNVGASDRVGALAIVSSSMPPGMLSGAGTLRALAQVRAAVRDRTRLGAVPFQDEVAAECNTLGRHLIVWPRRMLVHWGWGCIPGPSGSRPPAPGRRCYASGVTEHEPGAEDAGVADDTAGGGDPGAASASADVRPRQRPPLARRIE